MIIYLRNKLNKQVTELDELLLDEELAKTCYYKLVSQSGYDRNKQEFHYMKLVKKAHAVEITGIKIDEVRREIYWNVRELNFKSTWKDIKLNYWQQSTKEDFDKVLTKYEDLKRLKSEFQSNSDNIVRDE